jgi:hypothetical protein
MAKTEVSSARVAKIAARGLKDPNSLTTKEIQAVCGSVVTQTPDKPDKKKKK